jgi:hypothetical protein
MNLVLLDILILGFNDWVLDLQKICKSLPFDLRRDLGRAICRDYGVLLALPVGVGVSVDTLTFSSGAHIFKSLAHYKV